MSNVAAVAPIDKLQPRHAAALEFTNGIRAQTAGVEALWKRHRQPVLFEPGLDNFWRLRLVGRYHERHLLEVRLRFGGPNVPRNRNGQEHDSGSRGGRGNPAPPARPRAR